MSGEVLLEFSLQDPLHSSATPHQLQQRLLALVASSSESESQDDRAFAREETKDVDDSDDDDDEEQIEAGNDSSNNPPKNESPEKQHRRLRLARMKRKVKERAYELNGQSELAGVLFLEIEKITDLPPEHNSMFICWHRLHVRILIAKQ